jgi:hypothetical protein
MNFDVDRLARLAGLRKNQSGKLNEASNRSLHDDPGLSGEAEYRFGKGQLAESDIDDDDDDIDMGETASLDMDPIDVLVNEDDDVVGDDSLDEVLDIDENILRQEIRKMRRERVVESKMRSVIRNEIKEILENSGMESDSSWLYGDKKPRNSSDGNVSMGFTFGFEK